MSLSSESKNWTITIIISVRTWQNLFTDHMRCVIYSTYIEGYFGKWKRCRSVRHGTLCLCSCEEVISGVHVKQTNIIIMSYTFLPCTSWMSRLRPRAVFFCKNGCCCRYFFFFNSIIIFLWYYMTLKFRSFFFFLSSGRKRHQFRNNRQRFSWLENELVVRKVSYGTPIKYR